MDQTTATTVGKHDISHEVSAQVCYQMLGVTYVPHYTLRDTFVGPGNAMWPRSYLEIFGAERITMLLWPRRYHP